MSWGAPPSQNPGFAGGQYGQPPGNAPPPSYQGYQQPPAHGTAPPPGQGYNPGYRPPPPSAPAGAPYQGGYQQGPPGGAAGYPGGYHPPGGHQAPPAPPPGVSPELWHWFQSVDTDRSGKITAVELQQALMNGNWTPFNAETCRLMIGMFDRDRSGTIDIHEFAALWKYIQDWKTCFERFDTDRSGNINASELNNAFRTFGYNLSPNFCNLCVRVFDRRSTSTMNFDDFIQCCVMLKGLTDNFRSKDHHQQGVISIQYEEFLKMVLDTALFSG